MPVYKLGERGGLYKISRGNKVYSKRKSRFGVDGIDNIKETLTGLTEVLNAIEKKSGETIIMYPDRIDRTVSQAAKILQFRENIIQNRKGYPPVNIVKELKAMVMAFLIVNTNGNITTMPKTNTVELRNITRLLNKYYKRVFVSNVSNV